MMTRSLERPSALTIESPGRHGIGRRCAGVLLSGLALMHPSFIVQPAEAVPEDVAVISDDYLPEISDESWSAAQHTAITITWNKSTNDYTVKKNKKIAIPQQYFTAVELAANDDLVRKAFAVKAVKRLSMTSRPLTEPKDADAIDNGTYYADTKTANLNMKGDGQEHQYTTALDVVETAMHEASHGLTIYSVFEDDVATESLVKTCTALNATIQADYLLGSSWRRGQIATLYSSSAKDHLKDIKHQPKMGKSWKKAKMTIVSALRYAADVVRDNKRTEVLSLLRKRATCASTDASLNDLPEAKLPTSYYRDYTDTDNYLLRGDASSFDKALDTSFDKVYGCITDKYAVRDLVDDRYQFSGGHPRDDLLEIGASVFATVRINPEYVGNCFTVLQNTAPKQARLFGRLAAGIIEGTEKRFKGVKRALFMGNPRARITLAQIEAAADKKVA